MYTVTSTSSRVKLDCDKILKCNFCYAIQLLKVPIMQYFHLEAVLILFRSGRVGPGWVGSGRVGNSDNRANSVQLPVQLQAGTELGKNTLLS